MSILLWAIVGFLGVSGLGAGILAYGSYRSVLLTPWSRRNWGEQVFWLIVATCFALFAVAAEAVAHLVYVTLLTV